MPNIFPNKRLKLSLLVIAALLTPLTTVSAEGIIAVIEGEKIYQSDFNKAYGKLSPKMRAQDREAGRGEGGNI